MAVMEKIMEKGPLPAPIAPIAPDSALCQSLTCLPEKFIVDFANGIDVVRDHLRVQRQRTGFFARMYDGFTGQGARRQAQINASLADGVEASLKWLGELSQSLARSNWAIAQVNERVSWLTGQAAQLAHYSADTRQQLHALAQRTQAHLQALEREVARIDQVQSAHVNLHAAFAKWESGALAALSPAARCFATLQELRWGALGDYGRSCHQHDGRHKQWSEMLGLVVNRASMQLARDLGGRAAADAPVETAQWLAAPARARVRDDDWWQAVQYLADNASAANAPFALSAVQRQRAHASVPLISSARRVAAALAHETLPRGAA